MGGGGSGGKLLEAAALVAEPAMEELGLKGLGGRGLKVWEGGDWVFRVEGKRIGVLEVLGSGEER